MVTDSWYSPRRGEGVGDFADGGVDSDAARMAGRNFQWCGAALEFGEGDLRGGIACAEGVQAGDLRALDFGVDASWNRRAWFPSVRAMKSFTPTTI